jgi:hypothetical protein
LPKSPEFDSGYVSNLGDLGNRPRIPLLKS